MSAGVWEKDAPRYTSFEWWLSEIEKRLVHPDAKRVVESAESLRGMWTVHCSVEHTAKRLNENYQYGVPLWPEWGTPREERR